METVPQPFADLLKRYRAEAGLTQEELAERASVSARTISDLERGISHRPYSHTVQRLVQALGLVDGESSRFREAAHRLNGAGDERGKDFGSPMPRLPIQPTPFIGRQREVEEVRTLLNREEVRLLTLTGHGGVGKTRLALRVAQDTARASRAVFFVSLASLADPDLVPFTIAGVLGISQRGGQPVLESLIEYLRDRCLFLVLDNFEHLPAAATVVSELLATCSGMTILVTSRSVLHLAAEYQYAVPPFLVPMRGSPADLGILSRCDAIQLFVQRARSVRPEFEMTVENAQEIVELCRRLDGLPLAIEMAAARISLLKPDALLRRLTARLTLLQSGARDTPARQQTLRATIAWSYDLLEPAEQQLFAQLGVFVGGFTVETAEIVCGAELDSLAVLVDNSLVVREGERLRMLETIREFALEKLIESSEERAIRARHAEYFLTLARSANLTMEAEGEQRHDLIIQDRDNIRAALDWARESGEIELGLQLATALENYWATNGPVEGRRRIKVMLDAASNVSGDLRALALRAIGGMFEITGAYEEGRWYYEQSLAEYRRLADERGIGIMQLRLAVGALRRGDPKTARTLVEESLRLHRKTRFRKGEAQELSLLAELELIRGNEGVAFDLFERSLELCKETGFVWWRTGVLLQLAERLVERGHVSEASERVCEALPLIWRTGNREATLAALALLVRVATERQQMRLAGLLWGAIEAEEARGSVGPWEDDRDQYDRFVLTHDGPEFDLGRREGRRLALIEAVEEALDKALES